VLGITRFGISKMKESALMQASVSCCVDVYRGEWATVVSSICNFHFCQCTACANKVNFLLRWLYIEASKTVFATECITVFEVLHTNW